MEDWPYRRCAFCRQLYDPRAPDELAHHLRLGHAKMPGIPDDGLETIPLDFAGVQPRGFVDPPPAPWTPQPDTAPYKTARKRRRRKGSFGAG